MENKYARIRKESGLTGRFIMRYIGAGYDERTYNAMEKGRVRSERIDQRLTEMLRVNPDYLSYGREPVFLDNSRVRDSDNIIRNRILEIAPDETLPEEMTLNYLIRLAEHYQVGWEYLVCGDEKSREYVVFVEATVRLIIESENFGVIENCDCIPEINVMLEEIPIFLFWIIIRFVSPQL